MHIGHLFVAEALRVETRLERVLFLPTADPPHRTAHAPVESRRAMVERAIATNPAFELDTTALEQAGPAYTADTLDLLREKYSGDALCFIAGADSLVRSRWRFLDRVAASLERFYVVARRDSTFDQVKALLADLPDSLQQRFEYLALPYIDVSATELRARVAAGRAIRYLVPEAVNEYIERRGLYRD